MFIGLASFFSALLLVMSVVILSEHTHSPPAPPPTSVENSAAVVNGHENTGDLPPQAQAAQQKQKAGSVIEDTGKPDANAIGGKTGASLVGAWVLTKGTSTYTSILGRDGTFTATLNSPTSACTGSSTYTASDHKIIEQSYSWNCNGTSIIVPKSTYKWSISGNQLTVSDNKYTNVFTKQ